MFFLRLFSAALFLVGLHGLTGTAAFAAQHYDGPIVADVVSVYVGDTLTVDAHPWPQITMRVSVRVNGIDTPEIRGKCEEEKVLAQNARTLTKRSCYEISSWGNMPVAWWLMFMPRMVPK